ncbi:MAG: O-antigen polymerase [Lactobacillus sp.]
MGYLVLTLLIILILAFYTSGRDFLSPAVLFSFSFFFSSCWAFAFAQVWSLNPAMATYLVISLGVLEFVIVSLLVKLLMQAFKGRHHKPSELLAQHNFQSNMKPVSKWKLYAIIGVQVISIVVYLQVLKHVTGEPNLSTAIYAFRVSSIFKAAGTGIRMPWFASTLWYFSYAAGFFFAFLLVKVYLTSKKISYPMILVVLLSMIVSTLKGDRTSAIILLIALITFYYCLKKKQTGWQSKGNFKFLLVTLLGLIVFLVGFKALATLLGRNTGNNPFDYLAVYIGAEIKNLDIFIRSGAFPVVTDSIQNQTFIGVSSLVGKIMNWKIVPYHLNLPFQFVNGHGLGNVFTTFYAWLYDFGYVGVVILVLIMAVIMQMLYEHFKYNNSQQPITFDILLYGYLSNTLLLSFFSNKFYETLFNTRIIYILATWLVLRIFMFGYVDDKKILKKDLKTPVSEI